MINKKDVFDFLEKCEITHSDTVTIHSSLRSIGVIDGGADGLIDAFCEYLSDGLFIVPTHTWASVGPQNPVFDVKHSEPCIGTMAKIAAFRADGVRSLHPTHSVAAFGSRACEYVKGEETRTSPAPLGSVYSRMYEENAKILLVGVGHEKNTYLHAVDERLNISNRLNPNTFDVTVIDKDGKKHVIKDYHTHYSVGFSTCVSDNYPNYKAMFDHFNAVKYKKLGNALAYCCDAVKMTDILEAVWQRADYDICSRLEDVPENLYRNITL